MIGLRRFPDSYFFNFFDFFNFFIFLNFINLLQDIKTSISYDKLGTITYHNFSKVMISYDRFEGGFQIRTFFTFFKLFLLLLTF